MFHIHHQAGLSITFMKVDQLWWPVWLVERLDKIFPVFPEFGPQLEYDTGTQRKERGSNVELRQKVRREVGYKFQPDRGSDRGCDQRPCSASGYTWAPALPMPLLSG